MKYILFFAAGLLVGPLMSFLMDVFSKEKPLKGHRIVCDQCHTSYAWFQHIPILNLFIGRRCRQCGARLLYTYPIMTLVNALLYVVIYISVDSWLLAVLYCLATSALLTLSVVDWRIYEIPVSLNYFIFGLGLIRLVLDFSHWMQYVIGFFAVSGFLFLIIVVTKGRGMGGGDVKLMAAAGLLLGWKLILFALMVGAILGSIIHVTIMAIKKAEHMLAFGPYLSMGIIIAMIWGEQLVSWYLGMLVVPMY